MNRVDRKAVNTRHRTRSANRGKGICESSLTVTTTKRKYRRKCTSDLVENGDQMDKEKCDVADNADVFNNDVSTEEDEEEPQKSNLQSDARVDSSPMKHELAETDSSDEDDEEEEDTEEEKETMTEGQNVDRNSSKTRVADRHSDGEPGDSNHAKSADQESDKKSVGEDSRDPDVDTGTPSLDSDVGSAMSPVSESRGQQKKKNHSQSMPHSRIDFKVGVRVEARDHLNMWYAAKIVQVDLDENEVLIHFERWSSRFDEWVSMDSPRLRAVARTSARKEKRVKPPSVRHSVFTEHKVNEVVMAKWTDCKMYPAKILSLNANGSYQVLFYDGFEKTVQRINVKRILPGEMEKVEFKCTPSTHSALKEKRVRGPYKKRNADKELSGGVEKKRQRMTSPPGRSEPKDRKGTTPQGVPPKRQKLLVGGIFQAKRHSGAKSPPPNTKKRVGSSRTEKSTKRNDDSDVPKQKKVKHKCVGSHNSESEKATVRSVEPVASVETTKDETKVATGQDEVIAEGIPQNKRKFSVGVARKEFKIEADHNQHKCPIDGCGKGFRKEANLQSHMKHYHNDMNVSEVDGRKEEEKPKLEKDKMLKEALKSPPLEPGTVDIAVGERLTARETSPSKDSAEPSRKLVAQKRRQMLLQKRLENLRKKRPVETDQPLQATNKGDGVKATKRHHSSGSGKTAKAGAAKCAKVDGEQKRQKGPDVVEVHMKNKKKKNDAENKPEVGSPTPAALGDSTTVVGHTVQGKASKKKKDANAGCALVDACNYTDGNETGKLLSDTKIKKEKCGNKMSLLVGKELQMKVWNDEEREEVVNCICGLQEEDGLMMQCEICLAWQHGTCFHIEEESKVPENYVCYSCTNPKGFRKRCRYMHEQDWLKRGELASFKFLPENSTEWRQKENIMKTHAIASQVSSIRRLLPSLHFKLNLARLPDHPCLRLWADPWDSNYRTRDYRPEKVECKMEPVDLTAAVEMQPICAFGDHSYSAPDRTRLPAVKLAMIGKMTERSAADICQVVPSFEGKRVTERWLPCDVGKQENVVTRVKRERDEDCVAMAADGDRNTAGVNSSSTEELVTQDNDKGGVDLDICRLNLLDHIEQLQDDVDRRLDELGQLLEGMEAEFESSPIATSGDFSADRVRIKRMMQALLEDLGKVQRMTLYC